MKQSDLSAVYSHDCIADGLSPQFLFQIHFQIGNIAIPLKSDDVVGNQAFNKVFMIRDGAECIWIRKRNMQEKSARQG